MFRIYEGTVYRVLQSSIGDTKVVRVHDGKARYFQPGEDSDQLTRELSKCPSHAAKEALLSEYF